MSVSVTNSYNSRCDSFYSAMSHHTYSENLTFSKCHPDTITLYVKKHGTLKTHHIESVVNCIAKYLPLIGSAVGAIRVYESVRFLKNTSKSDPLYNEGLLNLARGIIETCPGTGLFLIVYDAARHYAIRRKIEKSFSAVENRSLEENDALVGIYLNKHSEFRFNLNAIRSNSRETLDTPDQIMNCFSQQFRVNLSYFGLARDDPHGGKHRRELDKFKLY